jgi:hypothetical protein
MKESRIALHPSCSAILQVRVDSPQDGTVLTERIWRR